MMYQIEKLRSRFEDSRSLRHEIMERQIRRLCDDLAPGAGLRREKLQGFSLCIGILALLYKYCLSILIPGNLPINAYKFNIDWIC